MLGLQEVSIINGRFIYLLYDFLNITSLVATILGVTISFIVPLLQKSIFNVFADSKANDVRIEIKINGQTKDFILQDSLDLTQKADNVIKLFEEIQPKIRIEQRGECHE